MRLCPCCFRTFALLPGHEGPSLAFQTLHDLASCQCCGAHLAGERGGPRALVPSSLKQDSTLSHFCFSLFWNMLISSGCSTTFMTWLVFLTRLLPAWTSCRALPRPLLTALSLVCLLSSHFSNNLGVTHAPTSWLCGILNIIAGEHSPQNQPCLSTSQSCCPEQLISGPRAWFPHL